MLAPDLANVFLSIELTAKVAAICCTCRSLIFVVIFLYLSWEVGVTALKSLATFHIADTLGRGISDARNQPEVAHNIHSCLSRRSQSLIHVFDHVQLLALHAESYGWPC